MTQIAARIDDELAAELDRLVAGGAVASRSEAVRSGLRMLVDTWRRRSVAVAIVDGYRRIPQARDEGGWSDEATIRMIHEEPW